MLVAVTGCVAQQLGEKLVSRQVRLVAGSDGISGAPQAIERLLDEPALRLSLLDFTSHYVEREPGADTPSAPVGFVNIMQGCDNFCAYCIVPYTRGRQKSRLTPAILDECRHLLEPRRPRDHPAGAERERASAAIRTATASALPPCWKKWPPCPA